MSRPWLLLLLLFALFVCCPDTTALFEIQSGMATLEENKGRQKCLSVDNGSVCVVMEERQGNPRLRLPFLLTFQEDLDKRVPEIYLRAELQLENGKVGEVNISTVQTGEFIKP